MEEEITACKILVRVIIILTIMTLFSLLVSLLTSNSYMFGKAMTILFAVYIFLPLLLLTIKIIIKIVYKIESLIFTNNKQ